ncbi:hypothetical protein B005_2297 [Nocardiopsis alba ATCC BAA-2165]|uniref:Uncharacterized protein n=1 Tax=Nocardiopsis alba (strain ATCC BAA-2165 / BE74) TaxID=1205910 RepID=J7KWE7_NOCAA|nr:hypothetical protein B005_2297 [Nocardiopsis alba ATCC BAA-2165]
MRGHDRSTLSGLSEEETVPALFPVRRGPGHLATEPWWNPTRLPKNNKGQDPGHVGVD